MHLPGGYTKVTLERFEGLGMAEGAAEWDIRTETIPIHLRQIGSRLLLIADVFSPDPSDDLQSLREAARSIRVEDISDSGIVSLNWSPIPSLVTAHLGLDGGESFALWPSPVDHDVCFANAGFTEFRDSDERWNDDSSLLTARLFNQLKRKGTPRFRKASRWYWRSIFWRQTPDHILLGEVEAGFHDDRLVCQIDFGNPAAVTLSVDGSQIWWISGAGWNEDQMAQLAIDVARGRQVKKLVLDWPKFAP